MTTSDEATIARLQTLLQRYRDGVTAFAAADRDLADPDIAGELARFKQDRLKLLKETEQRLHDFRASIAPDPEPIATITLEFGRANEDPVGQLLSGLERNEDLTLTLLAEGRREPDLDGITRKMFERHYERVQTAHARIQQLRDRCQT